MIKELSQTSSFYDLTKFLVFSFNASDQKVVEDILVTREKGLLDEVQKMKKCCQNLEKERDDMQKMMKLELELFKENYDKGFKKDRDLLEKNLRMELELSRKKNEKELEKNLRMELELSKQEYEKELKQELDIMQKNMKIELELLAKKKYEKELKQELDMIQKNMRVELELGKEKYKKELEQESDLLEKNLRTEFELTRKNYEKELEIEKELFEKNVRVELELSKETHEKELKGKQDLMEKKLFLVEKENLELVKELRNEFKKKIVVFDCHGKMELEEFRKELEKKIEVFGSKLTFAAMKKMELEGELIREFEKKIEVFEDKLSLAAKEKMELEENIEMLEIMLSLAETEKSELKELLGREFEEKIEVLERKLSLVAMEKSELEEKLRREFKEKIEVLEGENPDLEKKKELHKERLGKILALVEERLAKFTVVFANVSSGNAEANRGSENDSCGRVISMSDSHNKASDLKGCPTKTQTSLGNPSSKTSQLESEDLEGITYGDRLGVKTGGSFLEYEPEAGGYRDSSINCNRKRSVDRTEDASDSLGDYKKTKHLLESGCRTVSLPINFLKNLNPASTGTSKANPPPKFSSTSIEQHDNRNRRHENSELHFTKSISRAVDGTNRFSRGDPHLLSPVKNVVAGFESGKEIKWEHRAEMLSAFGNDPQLCMAAVCALYRRTISGRVSGNRGGFSSFDIVSGTSAAKYLINSDPANKLSKSVSEVQQDRPAILETCKRLAIHYELQLFEIYQKKLDPFFCWKS